MEATMNSDQLKGNWKQLMGDAKKQWGKLTDDDLQQVEGRKDKLVGKIQERYGSSREEAEKQADDWLGKHG
jgi:uncharacterized protein YjbJ (UPF0337 family)